MMKQVRLAAIGVGANLHDPARQVARAMGALADLPRTELRVCSALYRNPPMGEITQPDYINAVAIVRSTLAPESMLTELQTIEFRQGRRRSGVRWGARNVDLDLLCYGELVLDTARLVLPHPGVAERSFVVLPLLEVAPELDIPSVGKVAQLALRFSATELVRVARD